MAKVMLAAIMLVALSLALLPVTRTAEAIDCGDLWISHSQNDVNTDCNNHVDSVSGDLWNDSQSTGYVCISVDVENSDNVAAARIRINQNQLWSGWSGTRATSCANMGAQTTWTWEAECVRSDWCQEATALFLISYPCTSQQSQEEGKHTEVNWTDTCGTCDG